MESFLSSAKASFTASFNRNDDNDDDDDEGGVLERLPVLIIPGIMSSGLEVQKSAVHNKHIGERVWLNPIALGFGKLYQGKAFKSLRDSSKGDDDSSSSSSTKGEETDDDDEDEDDESSIISTSDFLKASVERLEAKRNLLNGKEMKNPEEQKELECKSAWLQHLTLMSDMCTEREGNEIRAIPGLDGVDFLSEIATIKVGASYVFGPVIKLLCSKGYIKGVNLDAVPYDWRIPPSVLESRDGYFTQTINRIEQMYVDCGCRPVVLVCHSMGCKTGHYLLNFCLQQKGRDWIDRYIHTYMPLGAPHIGAPSIIGNSFAGSLNEMLDPMLSHEERLVFARSLGSVGWLLPTHLPSLERNAPPSILCKKEGVLSVEILTSSDHPLDVTNLVTNKYGSRKMNPFRMKVSYGAKDDQTRTKKKSRVAQEVAPGCFDVPSARFLFPTPPVLESLKPLMFTIRELGDIRAHELEKASKIKTAVRHAHRGRHVALIVHEASKKAGKYKVNTGMSVPLEIDPKELLQAGESGLLLEIPLVARVDMSLLKMVPKKNHRSATMNIRVAWIPPICNENDDPSIPIAMMSPSNNETEQQPLFAPIPAIVSNTTTSDDDNDEPKDSDYIPLSGQALLRAEGLEDTLIQLAKDTYGNDPIGPRDASKPPVKRIYAIYGVNLDTEVSKVCRRVKSYVEDDTPLEHSRPRFKVDTNTSLLHETTTSGHKLEHGALLEHAGTPQTNLLTGERIQRSGDGTVPYYSLQQSQFWAKEVATLDSEDRVKIKELEGAEHREMLSDERFHTMLVDYLTGVTVL